MKLLVSATLFAAALGLATAANAAAPMLSSAGFGLSVTAPVSGVQEIGYRGGKKGGGGYKGGGHKGGGWHHGGGHNGGGHHGGWYPVKPPVCKPVYNGAPA